MYLSRNYAYHGKVLQGLSSLQSVTWAISISPALISFLYGILVLNGTIHYSAPKQHTVRNISKRELSVGPWTSIKPVQTAVKKLTHEEKRWNASWIKVKSELVIQRRLSDANATERGERNRLNTARLRRSRGSRDRLISPQAKRCVSTRQVCGTTWCGKTRTLPL